MICASCGQEIGGRTGDCPKCEGAILLAECYRLTKVLGREANGITYRASERAIGTRSRSK
jgi:hypothetical protein